MKYRVGDVVLARFYGLFINNEELEMSVVVVREDERYIMDVTDTGRGWARGSNAQIRELFTDDKYEHMKFWAVSEEDITGLVSPRDNSITGSISHMLLTGGEYVAPANS